MTGYFINIGILIVLGLVITFIYKWGSNRERIKIVDDFNGYRELVEYRDNGDGTLTVVKTFDVVTTDGVNYRVTGENEITY